MTVLWLQIWGRLLLTHNGVCTNALLRPRNLGSRMKLLMPQTFHHQTSTLETSCTIVICKVLSDILLSQADLVRHENKIDTNLAFQFQGGLAPKILVCFECYNLP